jgi:F-type H+-transporting ATPase subunit epsilon
MPIRCEIVSQDRPVFEGDVDMVVLPGIEGEMGILPNHAPLLTTLQYGVIKVKQGGETHFFTVSGGVAEIRPEIITILANAAESVDEIDIARAEAARRRAEERLQQVSRSKNLDAYLAAEAALRRSTLRLNAVRRYRKGARQPSVVSFEEEE